MAFSILKLIALSVGAILTVEIGSIMTQSLIESAWISVLLIIFVFVVFCLVLKKTDFSSLSKYGKVQDKYLVITVVPSVIIYMFLSKQLEYWQAHIFSSVFLQNTLVFETLLLDIIVIIAFLIAEKIQKKANNLESTGEDSD